MRTTKSCLAFLFALPIGLACATSSFATPAPTPSTSPASPAYWAAHNEVDYLDNLPRSYSCNDLYYKFRDVLLRLGARPGMEIYAYGCTGRGAATAKQTARVDLTYEAPRAALQDATGDSTLRVALTTVEVGPGKPKSLTKTDCVLLDDMRQTVIKSFDSSVTVTGDDCGLSASRARPFMLHVATLLPASHASPQMASTRRPS